MIKFVFVFCVLFLNSCDNLDSILGNEDSDPQQNTSWVFVANEGSYGSSNGSISMIDDFGNVFSTEFIGDIVQSIEVYGDKLIVLINNSHMIKVYNITSEGLSMPGIEVSTNDSSPREMVVLNDKVYFTNWNSRDIKVFNLITYQIEKNIILDGLPEDIVSDGNSLWVSIPNLNLHDQNLGSQVVEIDIDLFEVVDTFDVGLGPEHLNIFNNELYIARKNYSNDWYTAYYGTSKISENNDITIMNYGQGLPCGGSILNHNNQIYRTYEGGVAPLDQYLEISALDKLGDYSSLGIVYHAESISGYVWLAITDYASFNEVRVIDLNGAEIASYEVGVSPGDFAKWPNID